ncbi:MAG: hypothetical protein GY832_19675 [Chloroflexi bacterium]|nr:hypothetical protein [Chloroflexota bacterium]
MKKQQQRDYLSYLLRLWQTGDDENVVWRALLENPFTEERHGFASLQDLFAFLQTRVDAEKHRAEDDRVVSHDQERR